MEEEYGIESVLAECPSVARRRAGLKRVLEDPMGREYLWSLLSRCGLYTSMSGLDPIAMANAAGRRDIGLSLVADMSEVMPTAYVTMQIEAANGLYDGRESADEY